jgi:hypothetical protein
VRDRERAIPAALGAALLLWLYRSSPTLREAKALVLSPLAMLIAVAACSTRHRRSPRRGGSSGAGRSRTRSPAVRVCGAAEAPLRRWRCCSWPERGLEPRRARQRPGRSDRYSPALAELRTQLPSGSIAVVAPHQLLADQHGADWIAWSCAATASASWTPAMAPPGPARRSQSLDDDGGVVPVGPPERSEAPGRPGPCC